MNGPIILVEPLEGGREVGIFFPKVGDYQLTEFFIEDFIQTFYNLITVSAFVVECFSCKFLKENMLRVNTKGSKLFILEANLPAWSSIRGLFDGLK